MGKQYIGKEKGNRQFDNETKYFDTYIIKEGDTLYDIAQKNNIDLNMLAQINGILTYDYLYPNQEIMIPKSNVKLYITKQGDTLQNVASSINQTLNNIVDNNSSIYLLPDQLLVYIKE